MATSKTNEIKDFLQEACNLEIKIFATEAIIDTLSNERKKQELLGEIDSHDFRGWFYDNEGYKYSSNNSGKSNKKASHKLEDYVDSNEAKIIEKAKSKNKYLLRSIIFLVSTIIWFVVTWVAVTQLELWKSQSILRFMVNFIYPIIFAILTLISFSKYKASIKTNNQANNILSMAQEKMDKAINYEKKLEKLEEDSKEFYEKKKEEAFNKMLPLFKQNVSELAEAINNQNSILISAKKELNELYSKNIVHAKYRGLIPISTLCEYFDTGRCYDLAGPEGAYNLYESELRQNLIISELNSIDMNLNQIKNNQFYLYTSVNAVNQSIKDLSSQIDTCTNDVISNIKTVVGAAGAVTSAVDRATARIPVFR